MPTAIRLSQTAMFLALEQRQLRCLQRDVILRIVLCWLRLRPEVAHFLVSAVVQLVMTFKGKKLLSGAVLPMKRWPFRGSTSKTV